MARNFYKNLFEENMTPQNSTAGMRTNNTLASPSNFEKGTGYSTKPQEGNVPGHDSYPTEKSLIDKAKEHLAAGWNKAKEHAGAAKEWVEANPGKASAIGAATAAGLGALAFRKKIAEKLRKNK